MSRRGNCWDNAPQESFFGHLKDEAHIKACESLKSWNKRLRNIWSTIIIIDINGI